MKFGKSWHKEDIVEGETILDSVLNHARLILKEGRNDEPDIFCRIQMEYNRQIVNLTMPWSVHKVKISGSDLYRFHPDLSVVVSQTEET